MFTLAVGKQEVIETQGKSITVVIVTVENSRTYIGLVRHVIKEYTKSYCDSVSPPVFSPKNVICIC